jgi:hypothetical protein
MGEIKSAWEIAMEKVEKLGKLSPEELKKQREKEFTLIGQALAEKYLAGLDLWQLEVELDKYKGEEKDWVKKLTAKELIQLIELGNYQRLEKAIEGISYLIEDGGVGNIREEVKRLFDEYEQAGREMREEIERSGREILHQLRISGSAIEAINPRAKEDWQQNLDESAQPYKERLEELKQRLLL